jgi:hypothetical protein
MRNSSRSPSLPEWLRDRYHRACVPFSHLPIRLYRLYRHVRSVFFIGVFRHARNVALKAPCRRRKGNISFRASLCKHGFEHPCERTKRNGSVLSDQVRTTVEQRLAGQESHVEEHARWERSAAAVRSVGVRWVRRHSRGDDLCVHHVLQRDRNRQIVAGSCNHAIRYFLADQLSQEPVIPLLICPKCKTRHGGVRLLCASGQLFGVKPVVRERSDGQALDLGRDSPKGPDAKHLVGKQERSGILWHFKHQTRPRCACRTIGHRLRAAREAVPAPVIETVSSASGDCKIAGTVQQELLLQQNEGVRTLAVPRCELLLQRGIVAGSVETARATACVQQERQQAVASGGARVRRRVWSSAPPPPAASLPCVQRPPAGAGARVRVYIIYMHPARAPAQLRTVGIPTPSQRHSVPVRTAFWPVVGP